MQKRKPATLICAAALGFALLWGTEAIPKSMGRRVASAYVRENYGEMGLSFAAIEFSTAYGDYIASFRDSTGAVFNFRLASGYLPVTVIYDSVKRSAV